MYRTHCLYLQSAKTMVLSVQTHYINSAHVDSVPSACQFCLECPREMRMYRTSAAQQNVTLIGMPTDQEFQDPVRKEQKWRYPHKVGESPSLVCVNRSQVHIQQTCEWWTIPLEKEPTCEQGPRGPRQGLNTCTFLS